MRVKDKVIIVTGAGSGIGEGIARRLAEEGATVVVNDLQLAGGQRVAEEILAGGGRARFIQGDVTSSASMASLVEETVRQFGRLDVMVNNAGWTHMNQPMLDVSEEDFDRCYAVNVKSIYLSAIHATPVFRRQGGGAFINIASTAGASKAAPNRYVYGATKAAVAALTRAVAADFITKGIRCNCICPGTIETPSMLDRAAAAGPQGREMFISRQPMGRLGTADEIGSLAVYLASDESAFTTGVARVIDGGWTL